LSKYPLRKRRIHTIMTSTVKIERMAYGADAIGHLPNGKTVFVEGGAPGDTVEIELQAEGASFARATIARIVEPSGARVAPSSPVDALCGTAPWQHLSYDAQLAAKRENVMGALVHTARLEAERVDAIVAECLRCKHEWNYRNKIELACGTDAQGRFSLGFHREGTDEFVATESTALAHKPIAKAPKALRGAIRYAQGSQDLGIYRVGVRHSSVTSELEIAIWTPPSAFPRAVFAKTLSTALKTTSIVRVLAEPGKARKIKGVETLDGRGYWRERVGDAEFSTQAPSFFQVNTAQAAKLVETALDLIGDVDGAYIADLYAGGGTFSVPLALAGADVVAVEAARSSVRDLRYNAELNGVDIEVVGDDAARALAGLGQLDALLVDPPRAGLAESAVGDIVSASPERLVYVSCDPATWARDARRLEDAGYQLQRAIPVDMFPQTYHVEIASLFMHS